MNHQDPSNTRRSRLSGLCLTLLLSCLTGGTLSAQVLRVDADAAPGGDGSSWSTAYRELRDALAVAALDTSISEIWVAEGVYTPDVQGGSPGLSFQLRDFLGVFGGFRGTETARNQRDPVFRVTVLSGDLLDDDGPDFANRADNSRNVVTVTDADSAVLDGFTVRGGAVNALGGTGAGAGILCQNSSLSLENLIVTDNDGLSQGGGLSGGGGLVIFGQNTDVAVLDSVFTGNRARHGGAIAVEEAIPLVNPSLLVIRYCAFSSNEAITTGGAIYLSGRPGLDVRIFESTFADNTAGNSGGAIFAVTDAQLSLELEQCSFDSNRASFAGALYLDGAELAVFGCAFTGNEGCAGGAIWLFGGEHVVRDSQFVGNSLGSNCGFGSGGGGIVADDALVHIFNSVFLENAGNQLKATSATEFDLQGCTLVNVSDRGSSLDITDGTAVLLNCILWGPNVFQVNAETNVTANFSNVRTPSVGLLGTGNLKADPLFVDAAGGDLSLLATSPCVDAGDPATPKAIATDSNGDPRFVDGDINGQLVIDMGADEYNPIHLEITGNVAPGGNISIQTTGPAGLFSILAVGPPGSFFLNKFGPLFVHLPGAVRLSWPTTPSSVNVNLPSNIPLGTMLTVQQFAFMPGSGGVFSNPIILRF